MALDRIGLAMIAPYVKGAAILSCGYADITVPKNEVIILLGITPRRFTEYGRDHNVAFPLPETIDTLLLAGATEVDCVDVRPSRGVERVVDLNIPQNWPRRYEIVLNPGTLEHCFDFATAMFNAWRAVELGGVMLFVAPLSMVNHGFYSISPTLIIDFAEANGGEVLKMVARDRNWNNVPIEPTKRFQVPPESVIYAMLKRITIVPEQAPTQTRYRI